MPVLATFLALMAQDPSTPVQEPALVEDILVIGRAATPNPFAIFRALCLDANRLDGRAFRPTMVPRWSRMSGDPAHAMLGEGSETFIRRDGDLDMVLSIKEQPDERTERVQRNICSLSLVGPHDQQSLERGMTAALKAGGARDHLHYAELYPTYPGWTQLAWTAIPDRRDATWTAFAPGRSGVSGFVVITDPSFYRHSRYLVTELRYTDQEARPVSHITMTYLARVEP
jgi:hypothetical protein